MFKYYHEETPSQRFSYFVNNFIDGKKIIASKTLKDFEELLPDDTFFRPHHSHIINLKYISKYIKGDGGRIEMTNGIVVDVSRRKKGEFLIKIFRKYPIIIDLSFFKNNLCLMS